MKIIYICLFLGVLQFSEAADSQNGSDWLKPLSTPRDFDNWVSVPETDIYEVVASKEEAALSHGLAEREFDTLKENVAKRFTGAYYNTTAEKTPYLVRAVYGNGGTGNYAVFRRGNDLLIEHSSLGNDVIYNKSALILTLTFKPEKVYITCSIGR